MKILFLDIDGVLNSVKSAMARPFRGALIADEDSLDLEACARLQKLISQHKDLLIVVSSSWRQFHPLNALKDILEKHGIDKTRVIEYTPVIHNTIRGNEIKQWLDSQMLKSNFPVTSIAILDDDADMGELMDYLVQTDVEVGLQDVDLDKINEMFKKTY